MTNASVSLIISSWLWRTFPNICWRLGWPSLLWKNIMDFHGSLGSPNRVWESELRLVIILGDSRLAIAKRDLLLDAWRRAFQWSTGLICGFCITVLVWLPLPFPLVCVENSLLTFCLPLFFGGAFVCSWRFVLPSALFPHNQANYTNC